MKAMIGYGKAMMPHKDLIAFLLYLMFGLQPFFPTPKNTPELYSWCCVSVEKVGIQIVMKVIRKCVDDVSRN
jgi:hypothetical protein